MAIERNILSGQQLITLRLKGNNSRDLPSIGQKEFEPTNSWLEKKQIQSILSDRKGLIEEERVEKWSSLSSAEWMPAMKKAKVTKKIGKMWENFGHHQDDSDWLFPEEALLLLETNALELVCNTVPLSIERGYVILINSETGCTLNEYRTFSHLVRLGYKLFRHSAQVSVTRYEKEIRLDQHVLTQKIYSASEITNINTPYAESNLNNNVADKNIEEQNIASVNSFDNHICNNDVIDRDVVCCECSNRLDSDVPFPTTASKDNCVTMKTVTPVEICIEEDEDDDIIEIPVDKEIIIINDITSSESEEEATCILERYKNKSIGDDDSDSSMSKTSESNWKRKSNNSRHNQRSVINVDKSSPAFKYAVRTNYVTVNEFLYDSSHKIYNNANDVIVLSDDDSCNTNVGNGNSDLGDELQRFYKEIEIIDVESDTDDSSRFSIIKTLRKEILDSFPTYKNGEIHVKTPSSIFLPSNIRPIHKEYKMKFTPSDSVVNSYNDWSNHKLRTNVKTFVRAPNYQPSRPYGKSYQTNRNRPIIPYYRQQQWNMIGNNAFQNQIRAMATGVMQVATTLLSLPYSMTGIPSMVGNNVGQQFYRPFNQYQSHTGTNNANIRPMVSPYFNNAMMHQSHNVQLKDFNRPSFSNNNESYGGAMTYQNMNNQLSHTNEHQTDEMADRSNRFYNSFDCRNSNSNRVLLNEQMHVNQRNTNKSPPLIITNNDVSNVPQQQEINNRFFNEIEHQENNKRQESEHFFVQHSEESKTNNKRCFGNRVGNFSSNNSSGSNTRDYKSNRFLESNSNQQSRIHRSRQKRHFFERQRARHTLNEPTRDMEIMIDTEGDPSVFVDDIPIKESDVETDNENFIPLSSSNSNNTKNCTLNNMLDIGSNEFITNDIDDYNCNKHEGKNRSRGNSKVRPRRQRGRFQNRNPVFNSCCNTYESYSSKLPQTRPIKKQKLNDNNKFSRRQSEQNDVEILSSRNVNRNLMNNDKGKFFTRKRKRYFAMVETNKRKKLNYQKKMNEQKKRLSNPNKSDSSIEVIDNELPEDNQQLEEIIITKKENHSYSNQISNIKVENSCKTQSVDSELSRAENSKSNRESYKGTLVSSSNNSCANMNSNSFNEQEALIKIEPNTKSSDIKKEPHITDPTASESPRSQVTLCKSESHVKSEKNISSEVFENILNVFIKTEQTVNEEQVKVESVDTQDNICENIKRENVNVSENVTESISNHDCTNLENDGQNAYYTQLNIGASREQAVNDSGSLNRTVDYSWTSFKQQFNTIEEKSIVTATEQVQIQPIVTAKDCKSIETVLSALQIIGRAESCAESDATRKLKISYDVYVPKNVPLKKSARGLPDYRLVIVDFRDPLPMQSEMAELTYRFEDGVPILTAAVLPDSLSFFLSAAISLPTVD